MWTAIGWNLTRDDRASQDFYDHAKPGNSPGQLPWWLFPASALMKDI